MANDIRLLKDIRNLTLRVLDRLSDEQLLKVPDGFNNNILWNAGHMAVTQQSLTYGLAGQPLNVSKKMIERFKRGSSPAAWDEPPDISEVKRLLTELPETFEQDYEKGVFGDYREYETSLGTVLSSVEDGLRFNSFHEGLHFGTILALRKLV